jgi:beta-mannosidase
VDTHELRELGDAWQAARSAPGAHDHPCAAEQLSWSPARIPGTAAAALADTGAWRVGEDHDFDAEDWWFRTSFPADPLLAGEEHQLCLDGLATVAEVYLNGELVLESESMFAAHALDVSDRLHEHNELAVCCRALRPLLAERRRPRARWRTRLVNDGNLRFFRTMLLGRCPGIAPGPAAVGPWRPVRLARRRHLDVETLELRPRLDGDEGVLSVRMRTRVLGERAVEKIALELSGPSGEHRAQLELEGSPADGGRTLYAHGELRLGHVARWWPHTHGEPVLHDVRLRVRLGEHALVIDAGRVGFRELAPGATVAHELERDGLDLHVNGVRVFARGAVWTPVDAVGLAPSEPQLRAALRHMREAGMNMVRLPGTAAYEVPAFYDLCDELGILVWQDLMFANLDYPFADARFRETVVDELANVLAALGGRPSLAVVCGNSEVEQQAAMMGVDAELARGELFGELVPARVQESAIDCLYIPSAPCGGDLPFRPGVGIGTYYGVGCYQLPLEDVRRAEVRFAAECLAFSHIPSAGSVAAMAADAPERLVGNHPAWKNGIPRENGADWDFEDIRDHYLRSVFGVDASALRHVDHERYLQLSRALTGELLAEVFGEWRRSESPCGGALVLWLRDLLPGAGWGLIDSRGLPKLAYHQLARVLAPIAVWTVDEQLGGVVAHVANDRPVPLKAWLRVALYRGGEQLVEQGRVPVELAAHGHGDWSLEAVIGRFLDASWTYRFGPPAVEAIVVSLESAPDDGAEVLSQAVRFPAGRPLAREPVGQLGLRAGAHAQPDGSVAVSLSSARLAYGVTIEADGFIASDDGLAIEPGARRELTLHPCGPDSSLAHARVAALNMHGHVKIEAG